MLYNAKNRIRANRIQRAQNLLAIAIIYGLLLIAGNLELEDQKIAQQLAYSGQP